MILIIGGIGAGKRAYAQRFFGLAQEDIAHARIDAAPAVCAAQELVRDEAAPIDDIADALADKRVVICDEVGSGVVPINAEERVWRERAGRLSCELAARARAVVRLVAGVPCVIKGTLPAAAAKSAAGDEYAHTDAEHESGIEAERNSGIAVTFIRHGATPGNRRRCYVGAGTDEELDEEGVRDLERAACAISATASSDLQGIARVYTSGMMRTDQTARILFPDASIVAIDDLREMDFGAFEGKTADDLAHDAEYRAWVDGWCESACPNGESRAAFTARCVRAFLRTMHEARQRGERRAVFVVHGGTIKALLGTLSICERDYFSIDTPHGAFWSARFADGLLFDCERGGSL